LALNKKSGQTSEALKRIRGGWNMKLTERDEADIRAARAAYMREYRKRPEYQAWQCEYLRRPETKELRAETNKRYWLQKSKKLHTAD
jgi:hypothetical protein